MFADVIVNGQRRTDDCVWVWNEEALSLFKDYEYLDAMCRSATRHLGKSAPIPLDTALRCRSLVHAELQRCRVRVAEDCAPWFDISAFFRLATPLLAGLSDKDLGMTPMCMKCGWRKGGQDSWNGRACKCGHSSQTFRALLGAPVEAP